MSQLFKVDIDKINRTINNFGRSKILVIGDLMLDSYIRGKVNRISPEAPVPIVLVEKESFMPGGAFNVAMNIASLKGHCWVSGLIGRDTMGQQLKQVSKHQHIHRQGILTDENYTTIVKSRIIANSQQVVRVDREKYRRTDQKQLMWFKKNIANIIRYVDAIIVEDYGKGLVTQELLNFIKVLSRRFKKPLAVDPKIGSRLDLKGVTVVTPNLNEAKFFLGMNLDDRSNSKDYEKIGQALIRLWNVKAVLLTLGEAGMLLVRSNQKSLYISTVAKEVFDVSGAGDTVIATFILALSAGATYEEAAWLSNQAAGIVVGKLGTATVSIQELKESMITNDSQHP